MKKYLKRILIGFFALLILAILATIIYFKVTNYPASQAAKQTFEQVQEKYDVSKNKDYLYFTANESQKSALIIVPGGNVNKIAYLPLVSLILADGHDVAIVNAYFDLSIITPYRPINVINDHPEKDFYIAGHSLGGTTAAMFVAKYPDKIKGLIFLASYPASDMSNLKMPTLSISGSLDAFVPPKLIETKKPLFPKDATTFVIIEGGNHSQMGDYGLQRKDNPATITPSQQHEKVAQLIVDFMTKTTP